jgi:hypothetical protein
LIKEVEALHPTKDYINSSAGESDKAVFEENCAQLFPPGRRFASPCQLTQVAKLFLDAWVVSGSTSQGKKIAATIRLSTGCYHHLEMSLQVPPMNVELQ